MLMAGKFKKDVDAEVEAMSKALGVWAKRNNITVRKFEERMGWRYGHSWDVLRGKQPFSQAAWGRFIAAFGLPAFLEIAAIAKVDMTGKTLEEEDK